MSARTFFQGCGIGIVLTLSYTWEQLAADHIDGLYLRVLPVSTVSAGAVIDLIAAALLGWGLLLLLDRLDGAQKTPVWLLLTALLPALALHTGFKLAEVTFRNPPVLLLFVAFSLPALAVWRLVSAGYKRLVTAVRWGYLCAGTCVLWIAPQLAYQALHHQPREQICFDHRPAATAEQTAAASAQPRIVWVLFDELSYDQTFEHRQPDISLPAFDALRAQSTSFSRIQPAGYYTDLILPALLSGRPVAAIRSTLDGSLSVRESAHAQWNRFDPQSTLFASARNLGWGTAIDGWFNPYCRLFASTVDACFWAPENNEFPGHMRGSYTAWQNALAPLGAKFHVDENRKLAGEHRAAYAQLLAHSLASIGDPRARFLLLHLPVPHPPGIYNRAQHRMGHGSYLDNLVLADNTLGLLRAAIEKTPAARKTILIVSSDHSMRVHKWRGTRYWTAEDERTFHDRFDPRPTLLVHFPDQTAEQNEDAAFDELRTHDMIEAMLHGSITSTDELNSWVAAAPGR